jgi:hypothetical protein
MGSGAVVLHFGMWWFALRILFQGLRLIQILSKELTKG